MSILILMTLLLLLASCQQQEAEQELITVDVAASVPEKELTVQDFMDVEYVPLETNDDFVVPNNVAAIGESYIVMRSRGNDGTLYFFDRHSGKALHKFNHRGQGPEEGDEQDGHQHHSLLSRRTDIRGCGPEQETERRLLRRNAFAYRRRRA